MKKERSDLEEKKVTELKNRIILEPVREDELELLRDMQIKSFMPLYEKYHDDVSPALESVDRIRARAARPNRKYYFIFMDSARVGVINIGHNDPDEKKCAYISPIFILPEYQNQGIGYAAIQKAFDTLPDVTVWKLETILQEAGNCHLYEKCGFVRCGEERVVNDAMTLIDYVYERTVTDQAQKL